MSLVPDLVRCAVLVLGAAVMTVPARGQQEKPSERDTDRANAEAVLRERDRELMHPGDPLTVVGVEQQGNDIRTRTPALARSDRYTACVDVDEHYHRTLAMYESGASFQSALRPGPGVEARKRSLRPLRGHSPSVGNESAAIGASNAWPWIFALGTALLIAVWTIGGPPKPKVALRSPVRARTS